MFSVLRLLDQQFTALPEEFEVGGLLCDEGQGQFLTGQGLKLNLAPDILEPSLLGEFVVLKVSREDFEFKPSRISKVLSFKSVGKTNVDALYVQHFSIETQKQWSRFLELARNYFLQKGLIEITTPSLVECSGMEATLEPFVTKAELGKSSLTRYLPTSPELSLKKFLALGFTDIFEIKTCFRNNESSPIHSNEFQMLEWYHAFSDMSLLEQEVIGLVELSCQVFQRSMPRAVKRYSFVEAFEQFAGFVLTPKTTQKELFELTQKLGLPTKQDETFEDLVNWVLVEVIEPKFEKEDLLILHSFPVSMSALANINQEGWAERFEVYWKGYELANAFDELRDVDEQKRRFQKEDEARNLAGRNSVGFDPVFIKALERGLPPTVGIALGLDRLFMAVFDLTNIADVQPFMKSILD